MDTHEIITDLDHGKQLVLKEDYECSCFIFNLIRKFTIDTEGSYIPVHVPSGVGFMRALADEISKYVELKK